MAGHAFSNLMVEIGQVAMFGLEQFLDIERAIMRELVTRDQAIRRELGVILPDAVDQRRPERIDRKQIAPADLVAGDCAALAVASCRFAGGFDIGHGLNSRLASPLDRPYRELCLTA